MLLANDGAPAADARRRRVAVIGPNADRAEALFGCYSFVNHVLPHHPGAALGIECPTVLRGARARSCPAPRSRIARGLRGRRRRPLRLRRCRAAAAARRRRRRRRRATRPACSAAAPSGEGCDRDDLELPGVQRGLVEAVLDTGTPVVLVLLTGRPYAVGWALDAVRRRACRRSSPGEEGGPAIAGVLSGRVNPSGTAAGQPAALGRRAAVHATCTRRSAATATSRNLRQHPGPAVRARAVLHDVRARRPARWTPPSRAPASRCASGSGSRNTGDRRGRRRRAALRPRRRRVASPGRWPSCSATAAIHLEPGEAAAVELHGAAGAAGLHRPRRRGIVEPGRWQLWVGPSCASERPRPVDLTGEVHRVSLQDKLWTRDRGRLTGQRHRGLHEVRSDHGGRQLDMRGLGLLAVENPDEHLERGGAHLPQWLADRGQRRCRASADSGTLSKPITDRSSGTRSPSSRATRWCGSRRGRWPRRSRSAGRAAVSSARAGASAVSGR